jgi:hypothetical protein
MPLYKMVCYLHITYAYSPPYILSFFFFFGEAGILNLGLCACKAVTLTLEPHLQSILLWLFWRMESLELFAHTGL